MKYPLTKILKVSKEELVKKAHTLTGIEFLEWWVERTIKVVDEDTKKLGADWYKPKELTRTAYRNKCIAFWSDNIKECKLD